MRNVLALLLCLSVAAYAKRDLGEGTVVAVGKSGQAFPLLPPKSLAVLDRRGPQEPRAPAGAGRFHVLDQGVLGAHQQNGLIHR